MSKIESEYCDLWAPGTPNANLRVYLDREELKELNVADGINIIGTIDSIETESKPTPPYGSAEFDIINMKTAYYIDNITSGVFMVETFLTDNGEKSCIAESVQMLGGPEGGYRILFDQETVSTLNDRDFILASGIVHIVASKSVGPYSYEMELSNAELLVKGQDEITAYFEQIDNELNK